jgi:hypothetical protein
VSCATRLNSYMTGVQDGRAQVESYVTGPRPTQLRCGPNQMLKMGGGEDAQHK